MASAKDQSRAAFIRQLVRAAWGRYSHNQEMRNILEADVTK
jgi:hypothetical protein